MGANGQKLKEMRKSANQTNKIQGKQIWCIFGWTLNVLLFRVWVLLLQGSVENSPHRQIGLNLSEQSLCAGKMYWPLLKFLSPL